MKNKLILSITLSSFVGLTAGGFAHAESPVTETVTTKAKASGGKCASGKCGTEKLYEKAQIKHNPQDQLVRSRDGKCGIDAKGLETQTLEKEAADKCASGVCGQ